jgi:hypothetical protein
VGSQRDVRVAAEVAALHVRVGDLDVAQDRAQGAQVGGGLGGRAQIRLAHDLEQRHAGAVEIDVGRVAADHRRIVDRLARVLLHVDAVQAYALDRDLAAVLDGHVQPALGRERLLVLGDLVALRQVGIEVVLAREHRVRVHLAVGRERRPDRELHGPAVEHREHPGQRQADRMHRVVRRRAVAHRRRAEELRGGAQLGVDLEPDHHLEVGMGRPFAHVGSGGRARWCSVRRW